MALDLICPDPGTLSNDLQGTEDGHKVGDGGQGVDQLLRLPGLKPDVDQRKRDRCDPETEKEHPGRNEQLKIENYIGGV